MYWFSDADARAAKATMVSSMDQGYPWHEAASMAGVVVSRATAYRLWLRSWREGPSSLDDRRHGHPGSRARNSRDIYTETSGHDTLRLIRSISGRRASMYWFSDADARAAKAVSYTHLTLPTTPYV